MEKKKYRPSDIISVAGLLIIIYGFLSAMIILPDKSFSEEENRTLQTLPKLTFESLDNGKFAKDVGDYFADQMPLRPLFIGTKAVSESWLGKRENNGVIPGENGHIIAKSDFVNADNIEGNLGAVKVFEEAVGVEVSVAIAGRSQDVLLGYIPSLYPAKEVSDTAFSYVESGLEALGAIDLLTPLRERADSGEYVYYRTDHHWTTLGAYYAYSEIIASYGIEPYPIEFFTREAVSDEFYGTTWSKAGMRWVEPDSMEFFRFSGDEDYVTEIVDKESFEGFYERSYLEKKDKYSSFIGGNNGRVRITLPGENDRETLVLIKDSFGHSVAPFLAMHFDLEIIDLRYYIDSVSEVVSETGAEKVLVLYNLDSLSSGDELQQLGW